MGKEKRLFLLAVMTVMMSTAGYSEIKHDINDGKTDYKNETEIITKSGDVGVRIKNGTFTNVKDKGTIIVNAGAGIFVSADKGKEANFNNDNIIEINGGKGIEIKTGTVNNAGTITINRANNGIILSSSNSIFTNQGTIIIKEKATLQDEKHNAISISNGTFNNNGNIENKDRILLSDGTFNNRKDKVLDNFGEIQITGGKFIN